MKTTLDIRDELLIRTKKLAKKSGRSLRAVIEQGLRLALEQTDRRGSYKLPDCSVGDPTREDPLEALSWQDLRDEIYGKTSPR